jgi:hypothetical protein
MAASLGMSRAGSVSNPEGPDAGEHPAGVVQLLSGGHPEQLGQELLAIAVAVR